MYYNYISNILLSNSLCIFNYKLVYNYIKNRIENGFCVIRLMVPVKVNRHYLLK